MDETIIKFVKQIKQAMIDDSPIAPKAVTCLIHRKQKATHLCTDFSCQQNPILCSLCFNDPRWRSLHPHEFSIRPLSEGVEWMTSVIRNQAKSVDLIYDRSIGSRQFESLRFNLQKGVLLTQQLDNRIQNLRIQLQLQMELLLKQFQKHVQLEKQEFIRKLEEYKRIFNNNMELVRRECMEVLAYQNHLKFYNNPNNFTLKLINETERRSQEWVIQQKRIIGRISQVLQNSSFSSNLITILNRANKSNLFSLPICKSQRRDTNIQSQMRGCIKNAISGWLQIPQLVDLQSLKPGQNSNSNKYILYPISA